MDIRLRKFEGNPILTPNPKNAWESFSVCNPGAWHERGRFTLLYRAAGGDKAHRIHFGLATSRDGRHFSRVSNRPVLSPSPDGADAGCIEDPRIIKMGGIFYVTYAFRPFPPGQYWIDQRVNKPLERCAQAPKFLRENLTMSGLLLSKDLRRFHRAGPITSPLSDDRDAVLFPEKVGGKYVLLHRPVDWAGPGYGCKRPSIWMSSSDDLLLWKDHFLLMEPEFEWESEKIGGSTPPVKTKAGWLLLYHGVDRKRVYRTGAALLDLKDPRRILARSPGCVMEPEEPFETEGIMPNVVFPTGNVVAGGELFVYYGGGDRSIGLATIPLREIVDGLERFPVRGRRRRGNAGRKRRRS